MWPLPPHSCVKGCVGRESGEATTNQSQLPRGGVSSNTPVTLRSSRTSSTAHNAPSDSAPPPEPLPNSARTGVGLLSRLYEEAHSRLAPPTGDGTEIAPSTERLPWSRQISGWFARNGGEGLSWFHRESHVDSGTKVGDDPVPCADPSDEVNRKREEFVRECLRYHKAHSEDCVSRLPLMGMAKERGGARPLRQGMKVLERVKEKTQAKVVSVLAYHLSHVEGRLDDCIEEDGQSASDLALIGVDVGLIGVDVVTVDPRRSPYSGNWVSCYMQVERMDHEAEALTMPPSVELWEPYLEHPVLLKALQPLMDSVKLLVALGQEHLKDQLLVEGAFYVDQQMPVTPREAALELRDAARNVWSAVLERYKDGSVAMRGRSSTSGAGKASVEVSTGGLKPLVTGSAPLPGQSPDSNHTVNAGPDAMENYDRTG